MREDSIVMPGEDGVEDIREQEWKPIMFDPREGPSHRTCELLYEYGVGQICALRSTGHDWNVGALRDLGPARRRLAPYILYCL